MANKKKGNKKKNKGKGGKKKGGKGGKKKKFPGDAVNKGKDINEILSGLVERTVVKKLIPATMSELLGEPNVLGNLIERSRTEQKDQ